MSAAPPPGPALSDEELMEACVHHAARLAAAVHDRSRTQIAGLLALTPAGRLDVLAIALAGMVDPDQSVGDLLAWSRFRAPRRPGTRRIVASAVSLGRRALPREHGTERGYKQHHHRREEACPDCLAAHSVEHRPQLCKDEFTRLRAEGVSIVRAAELSRLTVVLARHAARVAAANASVAA